MIYSEESFPKEEMMADFLVAIEIDPMKVNAEYRTLPLHCTAIHWATVGAPAHTVAHAIGQVLRPYQPIGLKFKDRAMFGRRKDVPVSRLQRTGEIIILHADLVDAFNEMGATYTDRDWVGDGYQPYVADVLGRNFEESSGMLARKLYLVELMEPQTLKIKIVVDEFTLGDANMKAA